MRHFLYLFLPAIALLSACSSDVLYESTVEIPGAVWTYQDTVDFKFEVRDTSALYDLYVDFSYRDDFPHQNVYLMLYTLFPDGTRLNRQYTFDLFDAKGVSTGTCSGHDCRVRILLQENAFFDQAGAYVLTLEQYTRRDSLPGIGSVGFALRDSGKKR